MAQDLLERLQTRVTRRKISEKLIFDTFKRMGQQTMIGQHGVKVISQATTGAQSKKLLAAFQPDIVDVERLSMDKTELMRGFNQS